MRFCDRLKELREEKGLTQRDFATALNISRGTIAGYESQGKEPNFDRLKEFAEFFNVSIDYLVGFSDVREKVLDTSCTHRRDFDENLSEEDIIAIEKFEDYLKNKNKIMG
ncbi:MAG: helix-turn-helix domain-containing protein [Paraclostridium sp.]